MSSDRTLPTESTIPQLSRLSFYSALAVTLGLFFLLHPLWKPLDMDQMDRNIAWSYAPIPFLVLGLLAWEHKLRWSSWLLETLRLTLVKFAITWLFANLLWSFVGPPRAPAPPPAAATPAAATSAADPGRFEVREPPPATPIDSARTGRLRGIVVDGAGAPVSGALVTVSGGLERLVFAPPGDGLVLRHDESGFQPRQAVVLVYEKLVFRGAEGELHTVNATDEDGRHLFNLALTPGNDRTLMFDRPLGRVTIKCSVHGQGEHTADLAVVANPFAVWTGSDGRFDFEGVPAGALVLTAWHAAHATAHNSVALAPGGAADDVRLTLR